MGFPRTTKYNYIDIVNRLVPEYYRETDYRLNGSEEDLSLTFLGKLLKAATENDLYFDVSTLSKADIARYFVPQGKTKVSPNTFEGKFLVPYKKKLSDFETKQDFKDFLTSRFLPDTVVNSPTGFFSALSGYGFGEFSSLSTVHSYLIQEFGMFYFMNDPSLSGASSDKNASSIVADYVANGIFAGEELSDQEAVNALFRFFWENRETSTYYKLFFPSVFASSTSELSSNEYFSGTQMFDAIKVHLETWTDNRLKDTTFYNDSLEALLGGYGTFPKKLRDAGAFQRFLKAISLGIADINLIIEEINDLLSIDECPEKFLELLANNIGWKFLTGSYDRWRAQLFNAVLVYKTKGSKVGLDALCKLVFPTDVFYASSLVECWESYVPKLLYYLIKTESFVSQDSLEFTPWSEVFAGALPEGIKFNQAPENFENGKDLNYRFLVDAILQKFDNEFKAIEIGGKHYKELPMWTQTGGVGFYHRNDNKERDSLFIVEVPPWEKYGFYKEVFFDRERIDFLCNVLSGSRHEFGFEVDSAIVASFKTLLETALASYFNTQNSPVYSENNKFRFFTEQRQLPPNYARLVTEVNTNTLSDFDVWNTKGSFLFANFNSSSIDYTLTHQDTFKNKTLLETYFDVIKDFIPFHAVLRLTLFNNLNDISVNSQKLCIFYESKLDEPNNVYLHTRRSTFWAGASGTGILSGLYTSPDGRVYPDTSTVFWTASSTNLDRSTSRRRDYRYLLENTPMARDGFSMPISMAHYGIATPSATLNEYTNTWEFILKGFNYNTYSYFAPSSTVWDSSAFYTSGCAKTLLSNGLDLSTMFPVRIVGNNNFQCSSVTMSRNELIDDITKVIIRRKIRDNPYSSLSEKELRKFEFGESVHRSYHIYKNDFSGVLKNRLDASYPYYGGYNFISYAFGPTIWNSDFRYAGKIVSGVSSSPTISGDFAFSINTPGVISETYLTDYMPEWSSVIAGTKFGNYAYLNKDKVPTNYSSRTYFRLGKDLVKYPDVGVSSINNELVTREIISGIEIIQPTKVSESFMVYSVDKNSGYSITKVPSVTMFNTDGRPLHISIPFRPSDKGTAYFNELTPNKGFKVRVKAKSINSKPQTLCLELTTSQLLRSDGDTRQFKFNWVEQLWASTDTIDEFDKDQYVKKIAVSGNTCAEWYETFFNTYENVTKNKYADGTSIVSSNVHTSGTAYSLRMYNGSVSETMANRKFGVICKDGITLYDTHVMNTTLNKSLNNFSESDIDEIFSFWDYMGSSTMSRNHFYTSSVFYTSGGSRAEYAEMLGGGAYTSSSTVTDGAISYNSTLYEVADGGFGIAL